MEKQHFIMILCAAMLASCQSAGPAGPSVPASAVSTPPPFGGAPAPAAVPAPAQQAETINRTVATENVEVGEDGTITTTKTTTTVGFSVPAAAPAAAAAAPTPAAIAANGVPGAWKMQSSSTKAMCDVQLYGAPGAVSGQAASNCPYGYILNGITAWQYNAGVLSLLKGSGVALSLNQLNPNRFDGTASSMGLTTTIALYR